MRTPESGIRAIFNTGFGNSGGFNTGFGNSGNTNTGLWNAGDVNTGLGFSTDSGATNSGVGNTGSSISGFYNTASGGIGATATCRVCSTTPAAGQVVNGEMSGLGNNVSGGSDSNNVVSGVLNSAKVTPFNPNNSGATTGYFNVGGYLSGLFGLRNL